MFEMSEKLTVSALGSVGFRKEEFMKLENLKDLVFVEPIDIVKNNNI